MDDVACLAGKVLELLPGEAVGEVGDVDAARDADDLLLAWGAAAAAAATALAAAVAALNKVKVKRGKSFFFQRRENVSIFKETENIEASFLRRSSQQKKVIARGCSSNSRQQEQKQQKQE